MQQLGRLGAAIMRESSGGSFYFLTTEAVVRPVGFRIGEDEDCSNISSHMR